MGIRLAGGGRAWKTLHLPAACFLRERAGRSQGLHGGCQVSGGYGCVEKRVDQMVLSGDFHLSGQFTVAVFVAQEGKLAAGDFFPHTVNQPEPVIQGIY